MSWVITGSEKTPVDPQFGSVSLLLHGNGANGSTTITDSSRFANTVTAVGNAQISTVQSKFGGSSIFFNGTTDSLTLPDPALGTGNFTIELWLKSNSAVQYAQIIGNETSSVTGYSFLINNDSSTGGQITLYVNGGFIVSSSSGDWSDDSWHHIALVRNNGVVTLFTDGLANGTGFSNSSLSGTATAYIGRNNRFPPRDLVGYIDDFRITKGVARYTANFTPPTAPFPDI
jgi:hypothetical protein